jgi:NAD(P)-dependent dehydrogenase (short-subunit alcohol dehydrogenase family)
MKLPSPHRQYAAVRWASAVVGNEVLPGEHDQELDSGCCASEVEAMVGAVVETFGRIDWAFNNAGLTGGQAGQGGRRSADCDEEAFDRIVAVNLKGTWLCMRAELRRMTETGGGSIVNTASLGGIAGVSTNVGYVASKHAVVGMSKTAALEYARASGSRSCAPAMSTPTCLRTPCRAGVNRSWPASRSGASPRPPKWPRCVLAAVGPRVLRKWRRLRGRWRPRPPLEKRDEP